MLQLRHLANSAGSGGRLSPAVRVACLVSAACAVLAFSLPSQAQDGGAIWGRGGCLSCHGNLAAGDGDAAYPQGPNLRRTQLDRELLIEAIGCGRPDTEMPYNLAGAYTETACYGLPVGEAPPEVIQGAVFTADELATLVDFLIENVVGVTKITRENCGAFFGGNPNVPSCLQY